MRSGRLIAKRLKAARLRAGLSQKELGIRAGIAPDTASPRMNSYELERYMPSPDTLESIGKVIGVPEAYFYARDDALAELILLYGSLGPEVRHRLLAFARQHVSKGGNKKT